MSAKPVNPCRECKATSPVLILARDWEPAWGTLPPGAVGAVHCAACGGWLKWPSRDDARAATATTPDRLPAVVLRALRARGPQMNAKQGALL